MVTGYRARLALDGGVPVRTRAIPTTLERAGRRFDEAEEEAVLRVVRSGMLSSVWGHETRALESEFAELVGVDHAVACSSGTAAIHLAIAAVDPAPGDEIIVPPISDIGSVLPVLAHNAVPVFADVDPDTGCLDPAAVEAALTPRTRAIMAVHLFGKPAPVDRLRAIADRAGAVLIEDCAQSYLAPTPGGALAGAVGHVGCFSLQQHKHITAGDGGLAVTRDPALAERMRLFADKGWPRAEGRVYRSFALNYRMTELTAAVARAQLRKLSGVVADRRAAAARLRAALDGVDHPVLPDDDGHVYWYLPLLVDGIDQRGLARYGDALTAEGVPAIAGYLARPLYAEPVLRDELAYGGSGYPTRGARSYPDGLCPVAEEMIARRLVVVPWNENLSTEDVEDVAQAIGKVHRAVTAASDGSAA